MLHGEIFVPHALLFLIGALKQSDFFENLSSATALCLYCTAVKISFLSIDFLK